MFRNPANANRKHKPILISTNMDPMGTQWYSPCHTFENLLDYLLLYETNI